MKKISLLLLMVPLIIIKGCKKEKVEEAYTILEGKWQLVGATYFEEAESITLDYSEHNVIYDFRVNNSLVVSGLAESIENYRGHENRTYPYEVVSYYPGTLSPQLMKIGAITGEFYFGYDGSKRTLRINGPNIREDHLAEILRLVRIE